MGKTKIEWATDTWNPVTGCTKVSKGCANCYAEMMAGRFNGAPHSKGKPFSEIVLHPDRLDQPLHWRKPRKVFVCSMGDLFHEDVPDEFIEDVWTVFIKSPRHIFMVLTKRPERMLAWLTRDRGTVEFPTLRNVYLGVSVEDQATADDRIPLLLQTPAAVRFVSYEPALGPVDFMYPTTTWPGGPPMCCSGHECGCRGLPMEPPLIQDMNGAKIDWIIMGGESGPKARPMDAEWAREVRDQCATAGVPFFFKQMSKKAPIPDDLLVQQFPDSAPLHVHGGLSDLETDIGANLSSPTAEEVER